MPTAEEHLREEFGRLLAGYIVQNAILKSENEQLKAELAKMRVERDGVSSPARVSE